MKRQPPIAQEDLNLAIRKYLNSGGTILKLPDEKTALPTRVGGKWSNSEVENKQFNS